LVYLQLSCKSRRLPFSGENIMRYLLSGFLVVLILSAATFAQTRQQALDNLTKIKDEAIRLEKLILSPDKGDIDLAEKEKVNVFRIMPREKYRNALFIREGGAYYSFTNLSHIYDRPSQIGFEQNYLSVGFAGVNYGFISDLGEISITEIGEKTKGFNFLIEYQPPTNVPDGRVEQERARGFEVEGTNFKNRLPAIVGHSYLLRAITYDEADVMVAFKIQRKDNDESLIIFWKLIKQFDKPILIR
jgi:hypothetical protein